MGGRRAGAGWIVRWGSVRLARLEELEPGHTWWQVYGPPVLAAVLFGVFGLEISSFPLLVLRSVFVLVLVQVIFFVLEHRLILDRVMFPSMALALVTSLFGHPWWAGIATGLGAGLLFLAVALLGSAIFKRKRWDSATSNWSPSSACCSALCRRFRPCSTECFSQDSSRLDSSSGAGP